LQIFFKDGDTFFSFTTVEQQAVIHFLWSEAINLYLTQL